MSVCNKFMKGDAGSESLQVPWLVVRILIGPKLSYNLQVGALG